MWSQGRMSWARQMSIIDTGTMAPNRSQPVMRYTPSIIAIYELMDDLQTLWRMFCIVSSLPLPMN